MVAAGVILCFLCLFIYLFIFCTSVCLLVCFLRCLLNTPTDCDRLRPWERLTFNMVMHRHRSP